MPYDAVDRTNVEEMVRDFYAQVLEDEMLGPIFVKKLGTDINGARWYEHLQTLYNFWMLMMTGERGYGGHPFPSHAFLGPLTPETFERWLELFQGTVHRYYEPEIADKFYKKADMFAKQFMDNLGLNDENDNC